jgi:addiction module HigA family antidote
MTKLISLTHPGHILRDEFFEPLGITQLAAAKATGIPQSRLSEILAGRRSITADTAARLGRFFQVDPRNWLNLQAAYDLREVDREHGKELVRILPLERVA